MIGAIKGYILHTFDTQGCVRVDSMTNRANASNITQFVAIRFVLIILFVPLANFVSATEHYQNKQNVNGPVKELTISEIQGKGQRSPYVGQMIRCYGVITQFTYNRHHFWLQSTKPDQHVETSEGIFVSGGGQRNQELKIGDKIRIVAYVDEQQFPRVLPLTRLHKIQNIKILSSKHPLPKPINIDSLPAQSVLQATLRWESMEGMRVIVHNSVVVGPTSKFGEFVVLAPHNAVPGSGYFESTGQIFLRPIERGEVDYNPERILVDDRSLKQNVNVATGQEINYFTGVVDYTYGNYKIQASEIDLVSTPVSTRFDNRNIKQKENFTIVTYNIENLFDLKNDPFKHDEKNTPDQKELNTKLQKLGLAINQALALPDVLIVQEIENTEILQELANNLNNKWKTDYIANSFDGGDGRGIEVGFMWNHARVELKESFLMEGAEIDAAFGKLSSSPGRPPIVGIFNVGDKEIIIIGVHFKSKRGDDPLFGSRQPPIRKTEILRKKQARAVRNYIKTKFSLKADALILVAGDFNDFEFSEKGEGKNHTLAIVQDNNANEAYLTNIALKVEQDKRYSYIYEGNSQLLDHMLLSPALLNYLIDVEIIHINASYPHGLSTNKATLIRSSDHDPIMAVFNFSQRLNQ